MLDDRTISSTPYDDAFRTLIAKGGNLIIPLINEMFPSDPPVPLETKITSLANELYEEEGDGTQQKLVTDSYLHINGKSYHIECQSLDDKDIVLRMFRYDMGIAMQEARESTREGYHLTVQMPCSAVLFLRKTSQTPAKMEVTLKTPGGDIDYTIPAVRLSDYTLDVIMEKKLFFLLPFYMFNLEKEFPKYEKGQVNARTDVTVSLNGVLDRLDTLYGNGEIETDQCFLLTDLFRTVTESLAGKYGTIRKEMDEIMGGKILEFKWEKPYYEGKAEGKAEGEAKGKAEGKIYALLDLVYDGLLTEDMAAKRAEDRYGISEGRFRKMMASYHPDEERMQG